MLKIGSLSWKWCIFVRSQKSITAFSSPNMHFQKSVSVEFWWRRKNAVSVIKTNTPVSGKEERILKRKHGMLQVHAVVPHRKLLKFLLWNNVSKEYYISFSRPKKNFLRKQSKWQTLPPIVQNQFFNRGTSMRVLFNSTKKEKLNISRWFRWIKMVLDICTEKSLKLFVRCCVIFGRRKKNFKIHMDKESQ